MIFGCGYQNNPTEPVSSPTSKKILPEKISVSFPKILKDTLVPNNNINDTKSKNSEIKEQLNLQQLRKDIYKAEDVVKIAEFNLVLLEQVMPEMLEKCSEIEDHCIFEDKELSFILNEKTISTIDTILDGKERNFLNREDELISLGQIDFFKYENQNYELVFNMLHSSFIKNNSSISQQRQTLKWSTDTTHVTITYNYDNNDDRSTTVLRYFINPEGDELMYISDKNDTYISMENTTLLLKRTENNSSYSLTSNTTIQHIGENETNSSHFSANVDIDDNKTHLLLLDKNTTEIDTIEDNPVVEDITKPILVIGSDGRSTHSIPSNSVDFPGEEEKNLSLFIFEVKSDGLSSGDYLLLKPNTDTSELSLVEVLDISIGSFSVMEGTPQGSLYDEEYIDVLDELLIVKIYNSQESMENIEFMVVDNKPKLNIVKK